jgi:hypothetical protein
LWDRQGIPLIQREISLSDAMPVGEQAGQPAVDCSPGYQVSDRAEGQLVVDLVLEEAALISVGLEPVAMLPAREGALKLCVSELATGYPGSVLCNPL